MNFLRKALVSILILTVLSSCADSGRERYKLVRVIDGDSIKVKKIVSKEKVAENMQLATEIINNTELNIRMLGIDAPEYSQKPWGLRARKFLADMIDKEVYLEFDLEKFDKYGRTLAYVFNADNKFLNLEMVKNGYATIFITKINRKYATEFKEAYSKARADNLNIWDDELGLKMSPYQYRKKMKKARAKKTKV